MDQLMHHKPQHKRQRSQSSAASLGQSPSGSQKDAFWLAHLHALEKHFRENKLRLTFADELGRAEKEVCSVSKIPCCVQGLIPPVVGGWCKSRVCRDSASILALSTACLAPCCLLMHSHSASALHMQGCACMCGSAPSLPSLLLRCTCLHVLLLAAAAIMLGGGRLKASASDLAWSPLRQTMMEACELQSEEAAEGHVNSTKEAQRLACFLFYNVVQDSQG